MAPSVGSSAAARAVGSLRNSRSAPGLASSAGRQPIYHRGENHCGLVKGFEHLQDEGDIYVPRAIWTETLSSPLNQTATEYSPRRYMQDAVRDAGMRQAKKAYLQQEQRKMQAQVDHMKATAGSDFKDLMRQTNADMARQTKDKQMFKEEEHRKTQVFREGLDEQSTFNAKRAHERRLLNAYDAAEQKLKNTQELFAAFKQQSDNRAQQHKEWQDTMRALDKKHADDRADKKRENQELRDTMREQAEQEVNRSLAQQSRFKAAIAGQDACYKHYSATTGFEEAERWNKETRRQDRDEKHHMMRTDMHYAQREMARERQRLRMVKELDSQLASNNDRREADRRANDNDGENLRASMKKSMNDENQKQAGRKAEELENQAILVHQMLDRQKREKEENPHYPKEPGVSTMNVTRGMLASAESWKSGRALGAAGALDITQRVDAPGHLSKPMGKPEAKPWVDIAKVYGPGGLVGVFGGDGPCASLLNATGGRTRLLTKTAEVVARDMKLNRPWHEGLTPEDLKAGRKAAQRRLQLSSADKSETMGVTS